MIGLGFGVFGVGYWILAYGWSQLNGCNAGFFDIGWPGQFKGEMKDGAAPASSGKSPAPAPGPKVIKPKVAPDGGVSRPDPAGVFRLK